MDLRDGLQYRDRIREKTCQPSYDAWTSAMTTEEAPAPQGGPADGN